MEEVLCEGPIMRSQENSVNVIPSASPQCQHQNADCGLMQDDDHQLDSAQYLKQNIVSGHWQSTDNHKHFETEASETACFFVPCLQSLIEVKGKK
ncbi:unnamed protein product [Arabis nemorensis]|nr:unnamed protein product [Arabis nemorensis]